jgi:DNA-binding transcriptional MocR family regulator
MKAAMLAQQIGNWTERRGPLHERLATALEDAIRVGVLPPQMRLPAERVLADALALSRTTVVTAYNRLRADGWLESRSGSGTWVCAGRATAAHRKAQAAALDRSGLINLLSIDDKETVDLAVGTPMPLSSLPSELYTVSPELQQAFLVERNYMPHGYPPLREAVARLYRRQGIATEANQILVTSGAQQAIALVTALLVQRGDTVIVETPTYFGALDAFRLAGARTVGVPLKDLHVDPAVLRDRVIAHGPRLVYVTPTHHNPTSAVMPAASRRAIAQLARELGIVVVEDGTLADTTIDGPSPPPPLAVHAPEEAVLTIGSMSKLYWAGLRVGWLRGPVAIIRQLARIKSAWDLGSALAPQAVSAQLLAAIDEARRLRARQLEARRNLLVSLLADRIPEWRFDTPSGGLFLWVRLPGVDARVFAQCAARLHVAVSPGPLFSVEDGHVEFLRVPFLLDEPQLRLGTERLASAWRECRKLGTRLQHSRPIV